LRAGPPVETGQEESHGGRQSQHLGGAGDVAVHLVNIRAGSGHALIPQATE
jgi:hypothetical protein